MEWVSTLLVDLNSSSRQAYRRQIYVYVNIILFGLDWINKRNKIKKKKQCKNLPYTTTIKAPVLVTPTESLAINVITEVPTTPVLNTTSPLLEEDVRENIGTTEMFEDVTVTSTYPVPPVKVKGIMYVWFGYAEYIEEETVTWGEIPVDINMELLFIQSGDQIPAGDTLSLISLVSLVLLVLIIKHRK